MYSSNQGLCSASKIADPDTGIDVYIDPKLCVDVYMCIRIHVLMFNICGCGSRN